MTESISSLIGVAFGFQLAEVRGRGLAAESSHTFMKEIFERKRGDLLRLLSENREIIDEERKANLELRKASIIFFAMRRDFDRATVEITKSIEQIEVWRDSEPCR